MMRYLIFSLIVVLALVAVTRFEAPPPAAPQSAVVVESLEGKYQAKQLNILIVPGGDNEDHGAEFGNLRESDLTLQAASSLAAFLKQDPHLKVSLARDLVTGGYLTALKNNFTNPVNAASVSNYTGVPHSLAQDQTSLRLYSINEWAKENQVDLVIQLHFNDYVGRPLNQPGKYSGMTISGLPPTSQGEIDVIYGYIYEPQFVNPEIRRPLLAELNWQIYRDLRQYFDPQAKLADTLLLPYTFRRELSLGDASRDTLALERAVSDCPLTGIFDSCLEDGVKEFQKKYGIAATGAVGQVTLLKLNQLFSKGKL